MKFSLPIILSICCYTCVSAQTVTTTCNINIKGKDYALHLVEVGDNLYQVSKKYNSTVLDIWKSNPSIVDSVVVPGQVLKVPVNSKADVQKSTAGTLEVVEVVEEVTEEKLKFEKDQLVLHQVEKGQTLFAISRLYNVAIEDIITWNSLESTNLTIGDSLIVNPFGGVKIVEDKKNEVVEIKPSDKPMKTTVISNEQQDLLHEEFVGLKENGAAQWERGTASWLETNNPMMKSNYYALHKTAPIGTIIKVSNLVNKKYIFVKVIGKLPNTGENNNIQIRLSPAAKNDIILLDGKSLVELNYYLALND